jgi:hypothetical protein
MKILPLDPCSYFLKLHLCRSSVKGYVQNIQGFWSRELFNPSCLTRRVFRKPGQMFNDGFIDFLNGNGLHTSGESSARFVDESMMGAWIRIGAV